MGSRYPVAAVCALLAMGLLSPVSAQTEVGKYKTLELVFEADGSPANPFDTYLLRLELTDPSGHTFEIDGFYDGDGDGGQTGKIWKARICPYQTGLWSWRTVEGDAPDSGLENLSGQFTVTESGDLGGVVNEGTYFRLQEGPFIFLNGNFLDRTYELPVYTTHLHLGDDVNDTHRTTQLTHHQDTWHANKANIYFANRSDYEGWSVTPWIGTKYDNDKTQMDLERWTRWDDYLLAFKDHEMLAQMWFFADNSDFGSLPEADKNRLFRYGMARSSGFTHTLYIIALEWGEGWTESMVNAAGTYIQQHNPWGRLLSVHNHRDWPFSGQPWATYIATQGGRFEPPPSINELAIEMRANEDIPHIDEEFYKGEQDGSDWRGLRNMWANFLGGAAGGGTGSVLRALTGFLEESRAPFQNMAPHNELVEDGGIARFALADPGHHYAVYSETGSFDLTVSGTGLQGYWFNPRDAWATLGSPFTVFAGTSSYTPPDGNDWVLWITDGTGLNSSVTHPSTGAEVVQVIVSESGNILPTVALTAPDAGAVFDAGDIIGLQAVAEDADGTIARVLFYENGNLLGEDATPPYELSWDTTGAPLGNHQLRARAEDDQGGLTDSAGVGVFLRTTGTRVSEGLIAFYPFTEGSGNTVYDRKEEGEPTDLTLQGDASWIGWTNGVSFSGGKAGSAGAASAIIGALQATNVSTVEAWVKPANLTQVGPARMVSIGADSSSQNLVLGQDEADVQVRLRHTGKSGTVPRLVTTDGFLTTELTHLVHVFDGTTERLYVNGVQHPETVTAAGDYSNWDPLHQISIGNEASSDRPFEGEVRMVAFYDRPLSGAEILQNYQASPETPVGAPPPAIALLVGIDEAGEIELSWSLGTAPFTVSRGDSPDPGEPWEELTPPGGTTGRTWIDTGAATDGQSRYYLVTETP